MTASPGTLGLLLAAALTSVAPLARAQTQSATPAQSRPRSLTVSLGGGVGYESNVRFQSSGGAGDMATSAAGGVDGVLQSDRSRLSLAARGDATRYRELTDLNRYTYGVELTGARALTPRLNAQLGAGAGSSVSADVGLSGTALPLLTLVRSRTWQAGAAATYRLSAQNSGVADAAFRHIGFGTGGYVDASTLTAHAGFARQATTRRGWRLDYQLERSASEERALSTNTLDGALGMGRGALNVQLRAGAAALFVSDGTASVVRPTGALEARYALGKALFGVDYTRSVGAARGLDRPLAFDRVGLQVEPPPVAGFTLHLSADQAWSKDPVDPTFSLRATTATAEVRRPIGAGLSLSARAFLRRRAQQDVLSSHGFALTAGYTRSR